MVQQYAAQRDFATFGKMVTAVVRLSERLPANWMITRRRRITLISNQHKKEQALRPHVGKDIVLPWTDGEVYPFRIIDLREGDSGDAYWRPVVCRDLMIEETYYFPVHTVLKALGLFTESLKWAHAYNNSDYEDRYAGTK
jgi:hypothetical protein